MPRLLSCLCAMIILLGGRPAAAGDVERAFSGRFQLVDTEGRTVTDEAYAGKIRMVTFGYTYCPDICPTILNTMAEALDRLGADRAQVAPLFVSVDPKRDTLAHLKDYLASFPGITGLTGSDEQVAAAARNFKVRYEIHPPKGDDPMVYGVDHSASIYIMDRAGQFLAKMPHASAPDRVAERVKSFIHPQKDGN